MIHGDRTKIDLSISNFSEFINAKNLYIDKTKFIEDVINESNSVVLITRPRRTGKSLNMNMLRTFLDCKEHTAHLFNGLYVASTGSFETVNKHPVIFLDFKNIRASGYKMQFKKIVSDIAEYYLEEGMIQRKLSMYLDCEILDTNILLYLCEAIYKQYKVKPFILIDEYDKILMDNVKSDQYDEIKTFLADLLESGLKGNGYLEKAVLTGVMRISKESLFSGLNNLVVYDIFTPSVYDEDFSLTENEVSELLQNDHLPIVRAWYNNIRIGNSKLFNIYSVMSYLHFGEPDNYWGRSGTMDLLLKLMNVKRADELSNLISDRNSFILTKLERRLSIQELFKNDSGLYYYSLAVQSGYLTYDIENTEGASTVYRVYVPNLELQSVWRDFIMTGIVRDSGSDLKNIFENISDVPLFSANLQRFVDYQLSYFDLDQELEKTYHVFIFGMVLALGYTCNSNLESGYGRYDLLVESERFGAIIEFKRAASEDDLAPKADEALKQIDDHRYTAKISKGLPIYKIGIGCYKKRCFVKTVIDFRDDNESSAQVQLRI